MSDAQPPPILPDETLDYIADDVLSCNRPKDALLVAMKRVRAQYEKVFYWNEARLFRRISELEHEVGRLALVEVDNERLTAELAQLRAQLAESQPAAQPRWEPLADGEYERTADDGRSYTISVLYDGAELEAWNSNAYSVYDIQEISLGDYRLCHLVHPQQQQEDGDA